MRGIRRTSPIVFAAIVAVAFAAPAAASAAQWVDVQTGEPIEKPVTIELNGTTGWSALGTGYTCNVHGEAELMVGGLGKITKFEIEPETCVMQGVWIGCWVVSAKMNPPVFPLVAKAEGEKRFVKVSAFSYTLTFSEGCRNKAWQITAPSAINWSTEKSAMHNWVEAGSVTGKEPGGESSLSSAINGNLAINSGLTDYRIQ